MWSVIVIGETDLCLITTVIFFTIHRPLIGSFWVLNNIDSNFKREKHKIGDKYKVVMKCLRPKYFSNNNATSTQVEFIFQNRPSFSITSKRLYSSTQSLHFYMQSLQNELDGFPENTLSMETDSASKNDVKTEWRLVLREARCFAQVLAFLVSLLLLLKLWNISSLIFLVSLLFTTSTNNYVKLYEDVKSIYCNFFFIEFLFKSNKACSHGSSMEGTSNIEIIRSFIVI